MAMISDKLNKILIAVFGKEVRQALYDGLKSINEETESTTKRQTLLEKVFDQLVINAGNSNAEIVDARVDKNNGNKFEKIGDRLDAHSTQLAEIVQQKATKVEVEVERKRIDTFTSLPSGSTSGDAELIDGRIGISGKKYSNIGASIREQIGGLNNKFISSIPSSQFDLNFGLDKNTTDDNGQPIPSEYRLLTGMFDLEYNSNYRIDFKFNSNEYVVRVVLYDADGVYKLDTPYVSSSDIDKFVSFYPYYKKIRFAFKRSDNGVISEVPAILPIVAIKNWMINNTDNLYNTLSFIDKKYDSDNLFSRELIFENKSESNPNFNYLSSNFVEVKSLTTYYAISLENDLDCWILVFENDKRTRMLPFKKGSDINFTTSNVENKVKFMFAYSKRGQIEPIKAKMFNVSLKEYNADEEETSPTLDKSLLPNIKVLSYNIRCLRGGSQNAGYEPLTPEQTETTLNNFKELLSKEKADILVVTENRVFFDTPPFETTGGNRRTYEELFKHYYPYQYAYGLIVIYSRFPITSTYVTDGVLDSTSTNGGKRYAPIAEIKIGGVPVYIAGLHPEAGANLYEQYRKPYFQQVIDYCADKTYCILAGDFNTDSSNPTGEMVQFQNGGYDLGNHGYFGSKDTYRFGSTALQIDNIATKGFIMNDFTVGTEDYSDHFPVKSTLKFKIN
ncbi:endonuclease/exonuclease/phosphatase family protein [Clostridium culturomicium]|uniref:endonuclease/exonuclease/phosphatase family protein n=1 Tax=Clostridium culturomicium TaxID=1499683 RepID=UPI00385732DB